MPDPMTDDIRPTPQEDARTAPDNDFEEMLAGFDRIIEDKALQQELLDAGLLVRVDPTTGEPITPEERARTALQRLWASPEFGVNDPAATFADRFLAALQADPDAARAVVALLGGPEHNHDIVDGTTWPNCGACGTLPAAPQDDREAETDDRHVFLGGKCCCGEQEPEPVDVADLVEKARDWRYSNEWVGIAFRARLDANPAHHPSATPQDDRECKHGLLAHRLLGCAPQDDRPTILEAVDLIAAEYPNPAQVKDRILDALAAPQDDREAEPEEATE